MEINFYKYQGTGNDFIMIDNRTSVYDKIKDTDLIRLLCDRRFGIGADGLILLENSERSDFTMIYYNADGHLSSMCGNGGRCIVAFASYLGIIEDKAEFLAPDGLHDATINNGIVSLRMSDVYEMEIDANDYILDTGSPHFIRFVEDINRVRVVEAGRQIRYNERFNENGINVNFVEKQGDIIQVATYERGVEDETYSCGTGVTAAAIAYVHKYSPDYGEKLIKVKTKGGDLKISLVFTDRGFTDIHLIGPAEKVFEGEISL